MSSSSQSYIIDAPEEKGNTSAPPESMEDPMQVEEQSSSSEEPSRSSDGSGDGRRSSRSSGSNTPKNKKGRRKSSSSSDSGSHSSPDSSAALGYSSQDIASQERDVSPERHSSKRRGRPPAKTKAKPKPLRVRPRRKAVAPTTVDIPAPDDNETDLLGPGALDTAVVDADDRNPHGAPPKGIRALAMQWCYTTNNPTSEIISGLRALNAGSAPPTIYHVFQLERSKRGTLHCQGYIAFAKKCRMSTVKSLLGGNPHLEITRGTPAEAADYCKRPEKRHPKYRDFVHEFGVLPQGRGARTDLVELQALLDAGATSRVIATTDFSNWLRYSKALETYRNLFVQTPRKDKSFIFVFTGESGCGKSAAAYAFKDAFPVPSGSSGSTWFDGYDPDVHRVVVFDEFHGGRCSWTELLRLTDEYPMQVNTKGSHPRLTPGSHLQFKPTVIVFTSNLEPESWYKTESVPDKTPLLRRIDYHWQYYKVDSKQLISAVTNAFLALQAETDFNYYGLAYCHKGDPDMHPHRKFYEPFDVVVGKETYQWFAIRYQPRAPRILPVDLWE